MAITNINRADLEERIEEVDSLWDLLAVYNGSLSPERGIALILQGISELSASGGGGGGTSSATIASGIDASIDINTIIAALQAIASAPPLNAGGTTTAVINAINSAADINTIISRLTSIQGTVDNAVNPPAENSFFGSFGFEATTSPQNFSLTDVSEITVINKGYVDVTIDLVTTNNGAQPLVFPAGMVMTKTLRKSQGFITEITAYTASGASPVIINHSN